MALVQTIDKAKFQAGKAKNQAEITNATKNNQTSRIFYQFLLKIRVLQKTMKSFETIS